MKSRSLSLFTLGVFGPLAFLSQGPLALRSRHIDSSPFLQCGGGVTGAPGVVVVHLLDPSRVRSWNLRLEGGTLAPQGIEWAGSGTIRIETTANGHESACQATAPSTFHLRSTAARLAGTTLRVLSREPVRVEVQDSRGRVLAAKTVDPAARQITAIGW